MVTIKTPTMRPLPPQGYTEPDLQTGGFGIGHSFGEVVNHYVKYYNQGFALTAHCEGITQTRHLFCVWQEEVREWSDWQESAAGDPPPMRQ